VKDKRKREGEAGLSALAGKELKESEMKKRKLTKGSPPARKRIVRASTSRCKGCDGETVAEGMIANKRKRGAKNLERRDMTKKATEVTRRHFMRLRQVLDTESAPCRKEKATERNAGEKEKVHRRRSSLETWPHTQPRPQRRREAPAAKSAKTEKKTKLEHMLPKP